MLVLFLSGFLPGIQLKSSVLWIGESSRKQLMPP